MIRVREITKYDARVVGCTFLGGVIFGGLMTILTILEDGIDQYMEEDGPIISMFNTTLGAAFGAVLGLSFVHTAENAEPFILLNEISQQYEINIVGESDIELTSY